MGYYFTKTPTIVKPLARDLVWSFKTDKPILYLTFDDGPVKGVTDKVLDILDQFNAKATFFCVGDNVAKNPQLFNLILKRKHAVANHTFNHLNGWKTNNTMYFKNVLAADKLINSDLFRPPYGRITRQQVKTLKKRYKIIMWDVLSGDFDVNLTFESCVKNVVNAARPGSIIVFHDSLKAKRNMLGSLPEVLKHFTEKGYIFKSINQNEKIR